MARRRRDQQRAGIPRPARDGLVSTEALSPYAAALVIKQRIAAVGLDPATYSGHSLARDRTASRSLRIGG